MWPAKTSLASKNKDFFFNLFTLVSPSKSVSMRFEQGHTATLMCCMCVWYDFRLNIAYKNIQTVSLFAGSREGEQNVSNTPLYAVSSLLVLNYFINPPEPGTR